MREAVVPAARVRVRLTQHAGRDGTRLSKPHIPWIVDHPASLPRKYARTICTRERKYVYMYIRVRH